VTNLHYRFPQSAEPFSCETQEIPEEPGTVRCENRFRMKLDSFDRMSAVSYGHDLSIAGGRADF